jgi:hypothetical protein
LSSVSRQVIDELLNDGRILDRVKVELHLPVALGLRRCAILELPATLPDGLQLATQVDEACKEDYELVVQEPDPVKKWPLIVALKNNLQKGFEEKVLGSQSYTALTYWEKKLNLKRYMVTLRPTIREVYLYRSTSEWWTIRRLAQQRLHLREEAIRNPKYRAIAAFPEEFAPEYLRDTGRLLGYPSCCVEAYIQDRTAGTVAEIRLSEQLHDLQDKGKTPAPYSFFAKDFYPCQPECPEAKKTGLRLQETLKDLDQRLGQLYQRCLEQNIEFVENYGAYVAQHLADIDRRLSETGAAP